MLKTLYTKNYALIDEIKIEFHQGLNIITGETGAGKSILLGALNVILGDRTNRDIIRSGTDRAVVEVELRGPFSEETRTDLLRHDCEILKDELIIRREISRNGKSRCFINDSPATLQALTDVGNTLVDLHGQHEHQLLLNAAQHIKYLDEFAGAAEALAQVKSSYDRLSQLLQESSELQARAAEIEKTRDLLEFQLGEIRAVDPQPQEENELKREELLLKNAELLFNQTSQLYHQLYESDGSVFEVLKVAESRLVEILDIDRAFTETLEECAGARIAVEEISTFLQKYLNEINFDADRLNEVQQRIDTLSGLKKKYGGSTESVLQRRIAIEKELAVIENLDERIEQINKQIEDERRVLRERCLFLSRLRRTTADILEKKVVVELAALGMSGSVFRVENETKETQQAMFVPIDGKSISVKSNGIDIVEFLISTNPGEKEKPLATVASGGEISRIMLALKSLLAKADKVPVLVFDEIDIGISGRIAQAVGQSLRRLSKSHQILCITHLPQIASMAQHHYLVEKKGVENRTSTSIRELNESERIVQIAALLGGESVSDMQIASAHQLIQEANSFTEEER